jgi:phage-related protein
MGRKTQSHISWIKAAERSFRDFPLTAQQKAARALTQIGDGDAPEIAKPLQGFGSGVWELAIKDRSDAFRVVYIWVVHAFQKKSTKGITTPKHEIDLIRDRVKRLKEALDG